MITLDWRPTYPGIASAFGYSTHQKNLRRALEKAGVVIDEKANIAVHIWPPYFFNLLRFKINILTTTWEYDHLPEQWGYVLDKAQLIIVTCRHNYEVFSKLTDRPIEICPEGVDPEKFPYVKREMKEPFVFLYLGDDNPRKGTHHIALAWNMWNERYPEYARNTILIMKMTSYGKEQKIMQMTENSYADYRVLPLTEDQHPDWPTLGALYAYANAFLFPSMGEGWGLPLSEAMSTGLPCIYTPQGGPLDYASAEYAYPVEYGPKELIVTSPFAGNIGPLIAADPKVESIVEQMHSIYTDYDTALDKGKTAAAAMRAWFTWDLAAKKYIEILKRHVL